MWCEVGVCVCSKCVLYVVRCECSKWVLREIWVGGLVIYYWVLLGELKYQANAQACKHTDTNPHAHAHALTCTWELALVLVLVAVAVKALAIAMAPTPVSTAAHLLPL